MKEADRIKIATGEINSLIKELAYVQRRLTTLKAVIGDLMRSTEDSLFSALFALLFEKNPDCFMLQGEVTALVDLRIAADEKLAQACKRRLGWIPGSYKCRFIRNFRAWLATQPGVEQVQYSANDRRFLGIRRRVWKESPEELYREIEIITDELLESDPGEENSSKRNRDFNEEGEK